VQMIENKAKTQVRGSLTEPIIGAQYKVLEDDVASRGWLRGNVASGNDELEKGGASKGSFGIIGMYRIFTKRQKQSQQNKARDWKYREKVKVKKPKSKSQQVKDEAKIEETISGQPEPSYWAKSIQ
ncbi:hypothetical protein Tco_1432115, partial [Tanacetum coccineum]